MEAQEATPGSQSQESCVLDLPSACDVRDYVLQRSCQKPDSEAFSSVEFHSFPCSSDVDPDGLSIQHRTRLKPGAGSFIWVSHVGARGSSTWAIFCFFPRPLAES
nr:shieldin complex subunit 1 isoform X2 [Oryctolagus cuniculus]